MKPTAEIHIQREYIYLRPIITYEWVGPLTGIAEINVLFYKNELDNLPWPYEIIKQHEYLPIIYIQRTDYYLPWTTAANRLALDIDRFTNWWLKVQCRMILTAHVWGLAYVEQGEIPHWGCIGRKQTY